MSFMDRVIGGAGGSRAQGSGGKEVQALHGQILKIENQISRFTKMVDKLGTAADTSDHRTKMNTMKNNIQSQSKKLKDQILALNSKKNELDETQKTRLQTAVSSYMNVLDGFQKTLKLSAEREISSPPQVSSVQEAVEEKQSLMMNSPQQQAVQLDNLHAHNEAIIEERDQAIGGLVQDISELNEMFQDVAVLVHDQGLMVDDIESNITKTADRVQSGRQELVQSEKYQKKATSKKLWILLCVIITLGILVGVIIFTM